MFLTDVTEPLKKLEGTFRGKWAQVFNQDKTAICFVKCHFVPFCFWLKLDLWQIVIDISDIEDA